MSYITAGSGERVKNVDWREQDLQVLTGGEATMNQTYGQWQHTALQLNPSRCLLSRNM